MRELYVVAGRRRTLHRVVRTDTGLMTKEQDNLDQAKPREMYEDLDTARRTAKRSCRRCFPLLGGGT